MRHKLSTEVKLAAALIKAMGIPYEDAKLMTAKQIISLVEWHHHPVPKAVGGPDEPWNLQPEFKVNHRKLTRTETVPGIAKEKRIRGREAEHRRAIILKATGKPVDVLRTARPKFKWPSRPFPKKSRVRGST